MGKIIASLWDYMCSALIVVSILCIDVLLRQQALVACGVMIVIASVLIKKVITQSEITDLFLD